MKIDGVYHCSDVAFEAEGVFRAEDGGVGHRPTALRSPFLRSGAPRPRGRHTGCLWAAPVTASGRAARDSYPRGASTTTHLDIAIPPSQRAQEENMS